MGIGKLTFWYLATPYSSYLGGRHRAYIAACQQSMFLARHGIRIFSPIAHSHGMAVHGMEDGSSDIWDMLDEPFVHAAVGMIYCMLPGHEQSKGMARERDQFIADKKEIVYMHNFIVPQVLLDFRARQAEVEKDMSFYVRHIEHTEREWVTTNKEQIK